MTRFLLGLFVGLICGMVIAFYKSYTKVKRKGQECETRCCISNIDGNCTYTLCKERT